MKKENAKAIPAVQIHQWVTTKKGNQFQIFLPGKREICGTCRGKGHHVNPAIDGNGLSSEDFDEDPDFRESYLRGHYDVSCEECQGVGHVFDIDYDALTPKMRERVYRAMDEERAARAEDDAERRAGC